MELEVLPQKLTVCKFASGDDTPLRAMLQAAAPFEGDFFFLAKTDEELSLVCQAEHVPAGVLAREDGWRALRVQGPLDFSLVGILAELSGILAGAGVGIFAVSTFDTDYILVKEKDLEPAIAALAEAGNGIR